MRLVLLAVSVGCGLTFISTAVAAEVGQISGHISSASSKGAIVGIEACAYSNAGEYASECATTDTSGDYTIPKLPTGEYTVYFKVPPESSLNFLTQYYNGKPNYSEAQPVAVTSGSTTTGIDAAMVEGSTISGKVTDVATKAAAVGIRVCASGSSPEYTYRCTTSGAGGSYTVPGLGTGEYQLVFSSRSESSLNYLTQYYNGKSGYEEADKVSVKLGSNVSGIDAALKEGGRISGKASDASTKAALPGVRACVFTSGGEYTFRCATTNGSGEYAIAALPSGKYKVEFSSPYGSAVNYLSQYYNGTTAVAEAQAITVTTGSTASGINAALHEGGRITGTVTDGATKTALGNVQVCAYSASSEFTSRCATSNTSGEYTVAALAPGEYKVGFSAYFGNYLAQYFKGKSNLSEASNVSVVAGGTVSGTDAALPAGGRITGVVTDAKTKAGVSGVVVCAVPLDSGAQQCGVSDTSGEYVVPRLSTAEYKVQFAPYQQSSLNYLSQYYNDQPSAEDAEPVSVVAGSTKSSINAGLHEAGRITGKVTNASSKAALSGIQVCVLTSSGQSTSNCTSTDGSGGYALVGLSDGQYEVQFSGGGQNYIAQYFSGEASVADAQLVAVTVENATANIDAAMQVGAEITGTVTSVSSKAALSSVSVTAYDPSGISVATTATDSSGNYRFVGLPSNEYRVGFVRYFGNYLSRYYNDKKSLSEADKFSVVAGSVATGINGALPDGGKISGVVTDVSTKEALAGIEVCPIALGGEGNGRCAISNSSGEYTLEALPTGEYKIEFFPAYETSGNYLKQYYSGKASATEAQAVSVTAGSTTPTINAALQPGGQLTGKVTDAATKAAVGSIYVCAYDSSSTARCAYTNASGEYDITRLASDSYRVIFYANGLNYFTQYYNGKTSYSEAQTVAVTAGSTTPGINAVMQPAGKISGRVTDAAIKAPLQGITVCPSGGDGGQCALTNANGEYSIVALTTGQYTVQFVGNGQNYISQYYNGKASSSEAQAVSVTAGSTTSGINAAMQVGAKIAGRVTDASTKAAVAGVSVNVYQATGSFVANATTNANGEYTALALPPGKYKVGFFPSGYGSQYYNGKASLEAADAVSATAGTTTAHIGVELLSSPPVSLTPPSISGTAQQGQTLTESHGSWTNSPSGYSYQWQQCNSLGTGCLPIEGARTQTYVPTAADVGHTLRVQETATNASGPGNPSTSEPTAVVLPPPPVNTTAPMISGKAQQGQTLSETHGSWTNGPTGYTYQWQLCNSAGTECASITKATTATYVPVAGDVGHTVRVSETATNAGGSSAPATSAATAVVVPPVPVNTAAPTVSGTTQQGQTLTEAHGTWTNSPTSFSYQWQRCDTAGAACVPISNANAQSYVLTGADVGHTVRVQETAANDGGSSAPATSAATGKVVAIPPVNTAPPTVSGTAQQGQTLTEAHGTWSNQPSGFTYQWLRCSNSGTECSTIAKANSQTYAPVASDVGETLRVREIASNEAGNSSPAVSDATAVVVPPVPVSTAPPTVSGTNRQGQTLSESHGTWTNNPTGYTYQWLQCDNLGASCLAISGAKDQTYKLTAGDIGHTLRVEEIASNDGGLSVAAVSAATAAVLVSVPENVTPPTIAGTPQKGQTLVETVGSWTNEPTSISEQWLRCDNSGGSCQPILGATAPTYNAVSGDVGHTLRVQETAENEGGAGAPVTSSQTGPISLVPLHAAPGEDVNATTNVAVTFDGSGSTPAGEIDHYAWDFGDGDSGEGASTSHSYSTPGTYKVTLSVSRGAETDTRSLSVVVAAPPGKEAKITVVDDGDAPIAGADVLYIGPKGVKTQAATNGQGVATLPGLPDGTDTVYAYKSGFKPVAGQVMISDGDGQATLTLTSGPIGASTLKDHEMSLGEIEAAGIDTSDPSNQNVYEFEVRLAFPGPEGGGGGVEGGGSITFHCYVNHLGEFVGHCSFPGRGGGNCYATACYGEGYAIYPGESNGHPYIQWLVLRGKAAVLKQFFMVSMVVQDLSPEPFKFTHGSATLNIPAGLSLAPTAVPQSQTQAVADIPGEGSAETDWIVRGDTAGEYYLSANYHGQLEPFGAPVDLEAALNSPLHVWGASALGFHVQADSGFLAEGVPYHVRVGIVNNANVPLYNVAVGISATSHERFIFQPQQQFETTIGELAPGQTVYAPQDILVPDQRSAGAFDPALSSAHFVGEEIHPGEGIEAVPPPPLYSMSASVDFTGLVHLHWQPSPGSQGYEIYSTTNLDTPFADSPDAVLESPSAKATVTRLPAGATDAYIHANTSEKPRFYAVTTILGGRPTLEHPVKEPSLPGGPAGGALTLRELIAGGHNPSEFCLRCFMGKLFAFARPVDAPTGNFWHSFTDLSVRGRGPALNLTRTYNSGAASASGPFGYGWSFGYGMSLSFPDATHTLVNQENGSQVTFTEEPDGSYITPPRVNATLVHNADGSWTFVRRHQQTYDFTSVGQLSNETDRNGYKTTLGYDKAGRLQIVTDPAKRKLQFGWTKGHITSASDPLKRVVRYEYDGAGNLTDVINVAGGNTHFSYGADHRMLSMRLPNQAPGVPGSTGAALHNTYDEQGRVTAQTDALGRTTTFAYSGEPLSGGGGSTTVTDPKGNATQQTYQFGELTSETKGAGSPEAATWKFEYDQKTLGVASVTDPNGHVTKSTYDEEGNTLTTEDPLGRKTTNTYDSHNDLLTSNDPLGVATSMTYDAHGNLLTQSRPLVGTSQVQTTGYSYGDPAHPGDVTIKTDPAGRRWSYAYDKYGDVASATSPLYQKVTTTYNVIGWKLSEVSPRGNATVPSQYTTTYAYDIFGQVIKITDPLGHSTSSEYDPDQNLVSSTDGSGNVTHYSYDAVDQRIAAHRANGSTTQTTYWPDGTVKEQIDAAGHATGYAYDALGRNTSVTDPKGRTTHYSYDRVGNQSSITDPAGEVTTMTYDDANQKTSVAYSDGKTPNVTGITYDADGQRIAQADGSGSWAWHWDSLHRLTSVTEGSNGTVGYVYDLRNLPTQISYPGGMTVSRSYDGAGRMTATTDWHKKTTGFAYDADSNLTSETLPTGVVDHFTFDHADQMSETSDKYGAATIFAAQYARNSNSQLTSDSSAQPGKANYGYTALNQVCYAGSSGSEPCSSPPSGASPYGYDESDNLTRNAQSTQAFDAANQLCWSVSPAASGGCSAPPTGATTYSYDSRGNRTAVTPPASGPATALSYDQANRLVGHQVGKTTASYAYNGDGLRMAKTVGKATTAFTWDLGGELPMLLQDGRTAYVYGPGGLPLEQVTGTKTLWLHHDQLGSTRVLTGIGGTVVGSYTYDTWGSVVAHTGIATTNLQFDGQYTDAESGYQYLRARYYDPSTAQFLTTDPGVAVTKAAYGFAATDPLNRLDPLGLFSWSSALKITGAVVGVVGLGAAVCVATVGLGCPAAIGIGTGTLAAIAGGATLVGYGIDAGSAYVDCGRGNSGSLACHETEGGIALDVATGVYGHGIRSVAGDAWDLYSRSLGLTYSGVTSAIPGEQQAGVYGSEGSPCSPTQSLGPSRSSANFLQPASGMSLQ